MPSTVIIYGKEACGYTNSARQDYAAKGYTVDYRDVVANPSFLDEMLVHSKGQHSVPVIVEDGNVTIGYGGT
jgi:glutaredoxin 3